MHIIHLQKWKACQALLYKMGKESVNRRITQFDPKSAELDRAHAAEKIIRHHDVVQIRDVSKGAAAFFSWVCHICYVATPSHRIFLIPGVFLKDTLF